MSHLKQRIEKSCLNCNASINGRYCSICGQENLEPQESVWHLIIHFFNDITHFDGKFFSSLKYVITKPGFLSSEYMAGRRMCYLNPVRFYVFTSFIFFLILFSFFVKEDSINLGDRNDVKEKKIAISKNFTPILKSDTTISYYENDSINKGNSNINFNLYKDSVEYNEFTFFNSAVYKNMAEYDSLLKLGKINENWIMKILIRKGIEIKEKYGDDKNKTLGALKENVFHAIPQILFISVPFFALLLKLLYVRRRKFYYVAHAVFTIHFYIFIYINILLINFVGYLAEFKNMHWLYDVNFLLGFVMFFYLYKAMRNFYEQGRWKTIFKIIILSFLLVFLFCFLAILLFGFSIFKM